MIYGYARVSTSEQSFEGQVEALKAAGATKVLSETASGAKRDRAALARALKALGPGDVLLVTRLDRLARSTLDLLSIVATITDRKAGFKSLSDPWCDTTSPTGRLLTTLIGGIAEFERELIRARTGEGRKRAIARGVKMGRKPKLSLYQQREALTRRDNGETLSDIARTFGVSPATICRLTQARPRLAA